MTDNETDAQLEALRTALDQSADVLDAVGPDDVSKPTACRDWTVAELADHLVNGTTNFARKLRGEDVNYSAAGTSHEGDWAAAQRDAATDLLTAWNEVGADSQAMGPDWQSAELSVHTWDLADALGHPTGELDPTPAERGLAFMQANMSDEMRGDSFGPAQTAPDGADAYARIAAFAGRTV